MDLLHRRHVLAFGAFAPLAASLALVASPSLGSGMP